MGAPNGLPSASEVTAAVRDLQVEVHGLSSMPRQEWGVASFAGTDTDGHPVELAVYGRDAADAQWLRKVWRFCIYRDSGPTLVLNRLQQVEHEAYLTFLAGARRHACPRDRGGRAVRAGPRRRPRHTAARGAPALRSWKGTRSATTTSTAFLRSVLVLRQAGISHGALSPETVLITPEGPLLRDFRRASSSAPAMRTDRDLAAAVAAAAVVVGIDRAVAATCRVLDTETMQAVLTRLQRSTLDPETERMARVAEGLPQVAARGAGHRRRGRSAEAGGGEADQLAQPADGHRQPGRAVADHRRPHRGVGLPERHPRAPAGAGWRRPSSWGNSPWSPAPGP